MATAWQKTFGSTAKSCFKITSDMKAYGRCMATELKNVSGKKKYKATAKKKAKAKKNKKK